MNAFVSQAVGVYGTVNKNMKYNLMKHVETTGKDQLLLMESEKTQERCSS
jgi:hypothetical protein